MSIPVADALLARSIALIFSIGYANGRLVERCFQVPRCDKPFNFQNLEKVLALIL